MNYLYLFVIFHIIHIVYCHIVTNIIYFSQVATVASTAWYLGVNKPRKEAYANFYATYDADKDFQRMLVRFSLVYPRYSIVSHNYYLLYLFCQGCNVFQSQAIIAEKAAEAGGEEEEE